jgi:hypothetical protein
MSATGASRAWLCGNMLEEIVESKEYLVNSLGNLGGGKSGGMSRSGTKAVEA